MKMVADDDMNIKSVFFCGHLFQSSAPFISVYYEYLDFERIVDTIAHQGCTFTDYPTPAGSKPKLTVIKGDKKK